MSTRINILILAGLLVCALPGHAQNNCDALTRLDHSQLPNATTIISGATLKPASAPVAGRFGRGQTSSYSLLTAKSSAE